MSILKPKIQKIVDTETKRLIREKITSWIMGFASHRPSISVKKCDGSEINYSGVEFSGSPRLVFWSRYIEPFLEDFTECIIANIARECLEYQLNLRDELSALSESLNSMYSRIYNEMAKADQNLLGKGRPQNIPQKDVSREIEAMIVFKEKFIVMEIEKGKSKQPQENRIISSGQQGGITANTVNINGNQNFYQNESQPIKQERKTLFQKIWNDPVWSKIIANWLIGGAISAFAILYYLLKLKWAK